MSIEIRPDSLAGIALLLVQQHLQLVIVDETEVNQNLSNTLHRHRIVTFEVWGESVRVRCGCEFGVGPAQNLE